MIGTRPRDGGGDDGDGHDEAAGLGRKTRTRKTAAGLGQSALNDDKRCADASNIQRRSARSRIGLPETADNKSFIFFYCHRLVLFSTLIIPRSSSSALCSVIIVYYYCVTSVVGHSLRPEVQFACKCIQTKLFPYTHKHTQHSELASNSKAFRAESE